MNFELNTHNNYSLSKEQIEFYTENGFLQVNDVLGPEEIKELKGYMEEAMSQELEGGNTVHKNRNKPDGYSRVLNHVVNCWRDHAGVARYSSDKRLAGMAKQLTGASSIRLFHDHALWKMPKDSKPTPWHQDFPFWPTDEPGGLSIWIALDDVDENNGCMMFVPKSHKLGELPAAPLNGTIDVFHYVQDHDIKDVPPVICRMKAGSCTFHNGLTFHYAHANSTDDPRRAFAIIYMPDGTTYNGKKHVITDSLKLEISQPISGSLCPILA
jgi:ectoine hydroxylase-related dioxygenase (phytanoyl-CoA dioxygenase family)